MIEFSNAEHLATSDGKELRGIEVSGAVGAFSAVNSKDITIEGNRIVIKAKDVRRIRYGWKPFTDANLVNEEGLPASTFEIAVDE
jgi:sialate O-acetylesterase